ATRRWSPPTWLAAPAAQPINRWPGSASPADRRCEAPSPSSAPASPGDVGGARPGRLLPAVGQRAQLVGPQPDDEVVEGSDGVVGDVVVGVVPGGGAGGA